jgi:hypothetical protein
VRWLRPDLWIEIRICWILVQIVFAQNFRRFNHCRKGYKTTGPIPTVHRKAAGLRWRLSLLLTINLCAAIDITDPEGAGVLEGADLSALSAASSRRGLKR